SGDGHEADAVHEGGQVCLPGFVFEVVVLPHLVKTKVVDVTVREGEALQVEALFEDVHGHAWPTHDRVDVTQVRGDRNTQLADARGTLVVGLTALVVRLPGLDLLHDRGQRLLLGPREPGGGDRGHAKTTALALLPSMRRFRYLGDSSRTRRA